MRDDWVALLLAQGERIERKLDTLIAALAEDDGDEPVRSLDGRVVIAPRDEKKGLG